MSGNVYGIIPGLLIYESPLVQILPGAVVQFPVGNGNPTWQWVPWQQESVIRRSSWTVDHRHRKNGSARMEQSTYERQSLESRTMNAHCYEDKRGIQQYHVMVGHGLGPKTPTAHGRTHPAAVYFRSTNRTRCCSCTCSFLQWASTRLSPLFKDPISS